MPSIPRSAGQPEGSATKPALTPRDTARTLPGAPRRAGRDRRGATNTGQPLTTFVMRHDDGCSQR